MEVLTAENVPEDDNATRVMESMIDDGAKIIFATSLRPPRPGAEGRRGPPRRGRRPAGQLHPGRDPAQRRHLLRHGVRAGVPRRHRRRARRRSRTSSATSTPSRSRRRSPTSTPSSSAPQSVNPDVRDVRGQHLELVRPGQAGRGGEEPVRPGRRRDHPAPGLHRDDHQGRRGGRRLSSSATTPTPPRSPPRAGSPARSGTGATCTPTSSDTSLAGNFTGGRSTTPTTGSGYKDGDQPVRAVASTARW